MKSAISVLLLAGACFGDVSHILQHSTTTPVPRPYNFQYEAGRYPGHIDRVHQESGNGDGTVHGSYSYVDPKQKVRTVEYTADKDGFHAALINFEDAFSQPVDSEAVKLAKERHFRLYHRIADANSHNVPAHLPRDSASVERARNRHFELFQKIAEEHAAIAAQREAEKSAYEATSVINDVDRHQSY